MDAAADTDPAGLGMRIKNMYLTNAQITEAAESAVNAYEFSCCWKSAGRAAAEHIRDEFGVKPSQSQIAYAVRLAQSAWQGHSQSARRAIEKLEA